MNKTKTPLRKKVIFILLLTGFMFMEFPGVLFFKNIATPFILGLPFIYGYTLCWWAFMCVVLLVAYKCNWGENRDAGAEAGENLIR